MARSTLPPATTPTKSIEELHAETNLRLREMRGNLRKSCEELEEARQAAQFRARAVR